eukprot:1346132-Amorphochlora_amoeboformis.AAC.1
MMRPPSSHDKRPNLSDLRDVRGTTPLFRTMTTTGLFSVEALLAAPWLVLAPLNFVKVMINKPSPMAHHFVAKKSEVNGENS